MGLFKITATAGFKHKLKKIITKRPEVKTAYEILIKILREDPYNISRRYQIKKLNDIKPGDGQWRIRHGKYRLRYDIKENVVTLHTIKPRDKAY